LAHWQSCSGRLLGKTIHDKQLKGKDNWWRQTKDKGVKKQSKKDKGPSGWMEKGAILIHAVALRAAFRPEQISPFVVLTR
jgi:hypothetical protein